jgi:hypothetical protein
MDDKTASNYKELMELIEKLPVVDTHEHLIPESMRIAGNFDFFTVTMNHYASSDLISAGMTQGQMDLLKGETPFEVKNAMFAPYWAKTSNTTYCRALSIAAKDLYEIDVIDGSTLPELNRRMVALNKPGLYKKILEEKCNIKYCLWDQFWLDTPEKSDFFKLSLRLDDIVFVNSREDIHKLEEQYNIEIKTPEALEEILEISITRHKSSGLTAIKTALAYQRTLEFQKVSRAEAVLSMDRILLNRYSEHDAKVVQDYTMYSLAQKCFWHNLTVQVHTGLQEGNGNDIRNANPVLLSELVQNNPGTRFDIFHGGYPYGSELAVMAKMFPNVYADMAWLHVISPESARRYLSEWLDTVPVKKILGFGGDYVFVEGVYAHLKIAKQNIGRVLAEKVTDGVFTMADAKRYAGMLLYDNADKLFSFEMKL